VIVSVHIITCDRCVPGMEPGDIRTACRNGSANPTGQSTHIAAQRAIAAGWIVDDVYFGARAVCPTCQWRYLPSETRP
jgi:hypothetical protein